MPVEGTILPPILFPIFIGLATAIYGIIKEKHYVSAISILVTVINIGVGIFFLPIQDPSFSINLVVFGFGLFVISKDVHKQYKNPWVAFFLGSKTIGAITFFEGMTTNNFIMMPFTPLFLYITQQDSSVDNLSLYVHAMTFIIFIGVIHIIGGIISLKSKKS